jgi:Amt family ammonium transporter
MGLWGMGALDFAGGTVVHINAGIAGLVGCLMIGKRIGYGKEATPPHSLTMTMIGASLLWVGWFGFNAGSNLEANGVTASPSSTPSSPPPLPLLPGRVEQIHHGKPSMLGAARVRLPGWSRSPRPRALRPDDLDHPRPCRLADLLLLRQHVKNKLKYDDTLDVFGVHCIGGIVGAIGTGIVADPALGGQGFFDYTVFPAVRRRQPTHGRQLLTQIKAVAI